MIDTPVLLAESTIDRDDIRALIDWLESDPWLTLGPQTRAFERAWADWIGTRHAVFVNSGSSANLLMLAALAESGRLRNRRIVVPAVAWATTIAPAIQLGYEPLLCEADAATFGLDPNHLETLVARHEPAVVLGVHVLGVPMAMEPILALRERYRFALLEDACAATGSTYDGRRVGSFGTMATMSFYFGHHLSTIEGGMVCTSDDRLHELMLMLRSHGWAKDLPAEREAALAAEHGVDDFQRRFTFYVPGYNLRATDLQATLGLHQMTKADHVVARRVENHRRYQQAFASSDAFAFQDNPRAEISSISFAALAASRDHRRRVATALAGAAIETRPIGGGNMSRQPFWRARYEPVDLAMADRIHDTGFHLPNHPGLSLETIDRVAEIVLAVEP